MSDHRKVKDNKALIRLEHGSSHISSTANLVDKQLMNKKQTNPLSKLSTPPYAAQHSH